MPFDLSSHASRKDLLSSVTKCTCMYVTVRTDLLCVNAAVVDAECWRSNAL